jgi:hypothetical protein
VLVAEIIAMKPVTLAVRFCYFGAAWLLAACGSTDGTSDVGTGSHPIVKGSAQMPAMGASEMTAWLQGGDYLNWKCEPAVHEARSPSPHGFNRICSNDVLAQSTAGSTAWPSGAAAVKELHASLTDAPVGYAVYAKTKSDSEGGASWYWYEIVPRDSAAPHDSKGVVADGLGDGGPAKEICVGCHAAAGSDAKHTPSVGGRDQVYTPVSM